MTSDQPVTMQEACEAISAYWKRLSGVEIDPETIFNYSPTGELASIFGWYRDAIEDQKQRQQEDTTP